MASFNDFGKKLSGLVQNASKKSEEMIDNAKQTSKINRLENSIEDLQFELGRAYYEKHFQDEACEFAEYIAKINALVDDIQRRNDVLLLRRNLRNCPNCQTTVPLSNAFCSKCGMRLPPVSIPEDAKEATDALWRDESEDDADFDYDADLTQETATTEGELSDD